MLQAVEETTPVPAESVPQIGSGFYSAQNPNWPPLPANIHNLPAWDLGGGNWLLADQNFDYGALAQQNAAMHMLSGAMGLEMDSQEIAGSSYTFPTNGLWLEITNVANGLASLNLHNATNQVYAIWSTTNLLANWNVETEVWPANSEVMPFTVLTLDRTSMLFIRAEDWTGVDSDGDGIPDWWIWMYFGNLDETATNLDNQGNTLGYDYTNGINPNVIQFSSIETTNNYFNTGQAPAQLAVSGTPYYIAISVDDTNYAADAVWNTCLSSNITINLGSTEGWHEIWIGLRGHADDPSAAIWKWKRLKLDLTPPTIVVTNPTISTVSVPMVQIYGYCPEALASISYDLTNAAGLLTNQDAGITSQFYSTNTWELTTNYFECLDVPLTNGLNIVTIHATDLAGNTMTTNLTFTLDYSGATNPVIQLTWPQDGMQICQSSFTLRGWTEDSSAIVTAQIVNPNGGTNIISGLVERNGNLWVENLPLAEGTNCLTLTVTNSAGLSSATNISVVKSDMTLTSDSIDGDLWLPTVNVDGSLSDPTAAVWVNGVQGTNNGDGTWNASYVPVSAGGVASFDMRAIPAGGGDPDASANEDKPDEIIEMTSCVQCTTTPLVPDDDDAWYWYNDDYFYSFGAPSSGDFDIAWLWADGESGWQNTHYSWPACPGDCGEGTAVGTSEDDGVSSGPSTWDIDWEGGGLDHCDITSIDNGSENRQTGQTTYQLRVGGKSSQEYIMQVSAGITAFQPDWLNTEPDQAVPSQDITMCDFGPLDSAGNAYKKVSGGETHDITPSVKGVDYYRLNDIPGKQKYALTHTTECTAVGNTNNDRTTIGIGEAVDLSGMPGNTVWSLSGGGSISATNGGSITFTASLSPGGATVTAQVGTAQQSVGFSVIPPNSIIVNAYSDDPDYWGTQDVHGIWMGAKTDYTVIIGPKTVSFNGVKIRENAPASLSVTWPNGVTLPVPENAETNGIVLTCGSSITDQIAQGGFNRDLLFTNGTYVDFSYNISWEDQYSNSVSGWTDFAPVTVNAEFRGSDKKCRVIYQGIPSQDWQGPYQ